MSRKGKSSLYKATSFLRNVLRIVFLVIFFHWILWLTSYANCVNYQEAINEKNVNWEKELKKHDDKTKKYQRFTGWFNKQEEKDIGGIEDDVLKQIEEKKKEELGDKKLPRKWEKLSFELKELFEEKKKLEEKENKSSADETELKKKQNEYNEKFEKAKKETIDNIEEQLKENKLNITELDDGRSVGKQVLHDPLKFFVVSPLNTTSKLLGLHSYLFLEIIFKLLIIEVLLVWIFYETTLMWENIERARDPYLSVEEREQLNLEASSLFKYAVFNGCMMALFNFFLFWHPAFFDRTDPLFQVGTPGTAWYIWVFPIFGSMLFANLSGEFLRHGRLLTKSELKAFLAKSWVVSLLLALGWMAFIRWVGMSSVGSHLFVLLSGLVRFTVNIVRVKVFGHREYVPGGNTTRSSHGTFHPKTYPSR